MIDLSLTNRPSISLDAVDQLIIEQLKNDARQTVLMLAEKVGVNKETVRYRLNRLINKGALKIICASNIERLGYQFMLLMGIKIRPGKIDAVSSQLIDLPNTMAVTLAASHYNIMVWAFVRDQLEFAHFVSEELAKVSGATSIEIMHSFHTFKLLWRTLKTKQVSDHYSREELSDFDLAIINAMQENPRQTITKLAGTLGCSRRVARNALEKLIEDGIIGFWPVVNPAVMGYNYWVQLLIKTDPSLVKNVANALALDDTIMTVALITGQWQVSAVAMFKDSRHMSDFTSETLPAIPGIIETDAIPLGKILKFSTDFSDWI